MWPTIGIPSRAQSVRLSEQGAVIPFMRLSSRGDDIDLKEFAKHCVYSSMFVVVGASGSKSKVSVKVK